LVRDAARLGGLHALLKDEPVNPAPLQWWECDDLEVTNEHGQLLFAGPRYLRCTRPECLHLVTHGMIAQGGCWCGNRRLSVCLRLTKVEKDRLKEGYYPLLPWEAEAIAPEPLATLGWGKAVWERDYA
jgi:hypothetical protein